MRSSGLPTADGSVLDTELKQPRLVLFFTAIALSSFLLWAYFSEIDQVARAPGVVIPSSKIQVIQSKDGGVLLALPIGAGDRVKKGQIVAQFDVTDAEADYREAKARAAGLEARMVRLRAEIYGRLPDFSSLSREFPQFIESQEALYLKRTAAQKDEIASLKSILALVEEEIAMNEPLEKQGDVSKTELLRLQRQEAELVAQIINTRNEYFEDAQAEYNELEGEREGVAQVLVQRRRQLRQQTLTAPVAGVVKNIRVTTEGGVIRPGEDVMEIVPIEDDLVIEAKVSPADIGFISLGQDAAVKIDAFDYTIYGDLTGILFYISADTLEENTRQGDLPFYRVHVRTDGKRFSAVPDKDLQILSGMTATVEIRTGKNTILNYLLKPIAKTLVESLGER
ncbi:MAG: secretion protein [Porticoccaceae bacterium]|nr:secretion protein [Porticoccaceae bacterium]